jgi:thymidylate synthase (FAD)
MIEDGLSPQEARSVLPNSLKTEVVVTANYREWRHIFDLRCNRAAHPEMRRLMLPLLKDLYGRIPVIFDDIYEKYLPEMETGCMEP